MECTLELWARINIFLLCVCVRVFGKYIYIENFNTATGKKLKQYLLFCLNIIIFFPVINDIGDQLQTIEYMQSIVQDLLSNNRVIEKPPNSMS